MSIPQQRPGPSSLLPIIHWAAQRLDRGGWRGGTSCKATRKLAAFEVFGRDSKWQPCVATADKRKAGAAVIIHVDTSRCTGHAQCNSVAAEIYELDDLGYCAVDGLKVSSDQESQALRGAEACPERAIDVETSPASDSA